MDKTQAIRLLGGTDAAAATCIGISRQAISKWPEKLPPRLADRVLAALARKHLPASMVELDADVAPAAPAAQEPTHAA